MARARNIKPGLFSNEILGVADPLLTILFASLWCLADREGRLEDRPERIRVATFPYKSGINCNELLDELHRTWFIVRYKIDNEAYIQVVNFKKHQSPHHTERKSNIPACDPKLLIIKTDDIGYEKQTTNNGGLLSVKRSDSLIPDSLIPDSLIPDSKTYATARKNADLDFENFWRIYPKRPGANKTQAYKAWQARIKQHEDVKQMLNGAKRYREYCQAMHVEPQFIKQASTFLGPDKHYMNDWASSSIRNQHQTFADRLTGRKGGDDDGFTIDAE